MNYIDNFRALLIQSELTSARISRDGFEACCVIQWSLDYKTTPWDGRKWSYIAGGLLIKG